MNLLGPSSPSPSERNVVVAHNRVHIVRRAFGCRGPVSAATARISIVLRRCPLLRAKLEAVHHNFGDIAFATAILGIVLAGLKTASENDLIALMEILAHRLGSLCPGHATHRSEEHTTD